MKVNLEVKRASGVGFELMRVMRKTPFSGWNAFLCMHLLLLLSGTFRLTTFTRSQRCRVQESGLFSAGSCTWNPIYHRFTDPLGTVSSPFSPWVWNAIWSSSGHPLIWMPIKNGGGWSVAVPNGAAVSEWKFNHGFLQFHICILITVELNTAFSA